MIIEPYNHYEILCLGSDKKTYRWHISTLPTKRAWKLVNIDVKAGFMISGFHILHVSKVPPLLQLNEDLLKTSVTKPFSEDEFQEAIYGSSFEYGVSPSYHQSFSCQICGGIVASNICTSCMFDWDS